MFTQLLKLIADNLDYLIVGACSQSPALSFIVYQYTMRRRNKSKLPINNDIITSFDTNQIGDLSPSLHKKREGGVNQVLQCPSDDSECRAKMLLRARINETAFIGDRDYLTLHLDESSLDKGRTCILSLKTLEDISIVMIRLRELSIIPNITTVIYASQVEMVSLFFINYTGKSIYAAYPKLITFQS